MSIEAMMNMEKETNIQEMNAMEQTHYHTGWNTDRLSGGLIKSQKAIALHHYRSWGKTYAGYRSPVTMYILTDDSPIAVTEWVNQNTGTNRDVFIRTCPLTPRHGVLESTRCTRDYDSVFETVTHLQNVMKEHDPEGCLIAQIYQPASASCVLAPNMYAVFGEGHDGVTAGVNYSDDGTSLVFPLSKTNRVFERALDNMLDETHHDYDVTKHEIEMVFTDSFNREHLTNTDSISTQARNWEDDYYAETKATLTQIRGCDKHTKIGTPPRGVSINGSVPDGDVTVTEVVVMSGLEQVIWLEENITRELCPEGFVVVEPNGSLLSHINAHCRTHDIPYIITDEVCVGDTWTEVASGWVIQNNDGSFMADPYNPFQYIGAFRDGVTYGNSHWMRKQSALSTFFHQWIGQPSNDPELSAFLGGVFTAWLVKATIGATVGEMRHARSQKKNYILPTFLAVNSFVGTDNAWSVWCNESQPFGRPNTRAPYHKWMRDTIVEWDGASALLTYVASQYQTGWTSSYGGPKWGDGAEKGARVATLIHELMNVDDANIESVGAELSAAVNALENAQHNNGGLLNKFGNDTMTHFNAGTHGYEEGEMRAAFQSYMIAMDIVNDRIETNANVCQDDWEDVATYFSRTAAHWRKSPVLSRTDAPSNIQAVIDGWIEHEGSLSNSFHGDNHVFSTPTSASCVPCGLDTNDCYPCRNHETWKHKMNATKNIPTTNHNVQDEVWLLGSGVDTHTHVADTPRPIHVQEAMDADWGSLSTSELISSMCQHIEAGTYESIEHVFSEVMSVLPTSEFILVQQQLALAQSWNTTDVTQEMKE